MRLSDRQWALIEYFFPAPKRRRDGRVAALGFEAGVRGRHSVGAKDGGAVATPAAGVSEWADLLAAVATVGGAGGLATGLACLAGRAPPRATAGLG
jgi:hypothetical protein